MAISITTESISNIDFNLESKWNSEGYPLVTVSGQTIPSDIIVQHLISPAHLNLVEQDVLDIFEDAWPNEANVYYNDFILNDGCYYTYTTGDAKSPLYAGFTQLGREDENTEFNYSYGLRYVGEESQNIFSVQIIENIDSVITMASQPKLNNISVQASGVVQNNTDTRLNMNFYHAHELINPSLDDSKYEVYIEDKNVPPSAYNLLGDVVAPGVPNVLHSGDFFIDLPFTHVNNNNTVVTTDYFVTIKYYNQEGIATKHIKYNTDQMRKFNDDFEAGDDFSQSEKTIFKEISDDKGGLFTIDPDISEKRRLSLDVSDIYLESNKYERTGTYTSKYYNIDVPLYSIFLKVDDHFPTNVDKSSIKYYIQLGQLDPIQISPFNHEAEYIYTNNKREQITKLIVLDKLDLQGLVNISEVNITAPIYSFKVIIKFGITLLDGTTTDYFIPPFVDSYECHITDRQSYLRA